MSAARSVWTILVSTLSVLAMSGVAVAEDIAFVACPIYRDTDAGKKSGCWVADDPATGRRYDVSLAPTKPDWNHAMLVEGRPAADQTDRCGGVVLDAVRVSVLAGSCTRAMLPAEGFSGRRFVLPSRNVRPLYAPTQPVEAPYKAARFAIPFDFGRDFVTYQLADYYLDQAVTYALAVGAARITITGYADTRARSISGQILTEGRAVARARAERVAEWMRLRGVPAERLAVSWKPRAKPSDAAAFDGLGEASWRRVDIVVTPPS